MKFLASREEDENLSYAIFAEEQIPKISKSMLKDWLDKKDVILRKAYEGCVLRKLRLNPNKNPKHAKTHEKLHAEFIKQRNLGNKISFHWLLLTGKKLARKYSFPIFTRKGVEMFVKKFDIKVRRTQRKKQKPKTIHLQKILQWHFNLREKVIKSNRIGNEHYTLTWGRYPPDRRFNVDQAH